MKKVTILTAAGFNVPPNYGGISTQELTDLVRKTNPMNGRFEINSIRPGEYLYNILFDYYSTKMVTQPTLREVNFETIIYLVEEIFAFYTENRTHNPPRVMVGISSSFSTLKSTLENDINNSANRLGIDSIQFLKELYNALIKPVIDRVGILDGDNTNIGMTDFNTRMLNGVFGDWTKRIYTLNYDTWLNSNAGYYDGFNNNNFESDVVYNSRSINCHYNLHGSVRWRPSLSEDGIEKTNSIVDVFGYGTSNIDTINRQPLIPSPIITGYNKSSRLHYKPYIAIHHSFLRDIVESDYLLVVGYGGGDPHVNEILNTFRGRVLIIDYFSNWINTINNGDDIDVFDEKVREQLENNINPFGNGWANEIRWQTDPFVKSNDSRISVWWKGINNDLYNEIPNLNI